MWILPWEARLSPPLSSSSTAYLIQWDGDEVEVLHADDSIKISHTATISRFSLEGCDHVEATKNRVRLVLSAGLTE
jgi:hypothetical protein